MGVGAAAAQMDGFAFARKMRLEEKMVSSLGAVRWERERQRQREGASRARGRLRTRLARVTLLSPLPPAVLSDPGDVDASVVRGGCAPAAAGCDPPGRVPVVAYTGNAHLANFAWYLESGIDDFLAKPASLATLRAMVRKWFPAI